MDIGRNFCQNGFDNRILISTCNKQGLFKKNKGEWSGPFLTSGTYKMYIVMGKTLPQQYAYNDIKNVVEQSYKIEKGQSLYKKLVQESFKNENVQLFVERWK